MILKQVLLLGFRSRARSFYSSFYRDCCIWIRTILMYIYSCRVFGNWLPSPFRCISVWLEFRFVHDIRGYFECYGSGFCSRFVEWAWGTAKIEGVLLDILCCSIPWLLLLNYNFLLIFNDRCTSQENRFSMTVQQLYFITFLVQDSSMRWTYLE